MSARLVQSTYFCPKCDKMFRTLQENDVIAEKEGLKLITDHVLNTHPEYKETWDDIMDETLAFNTIIDGIS